jgi:hypothetical protein
MPIDPVERLRHLENMIGRLRAEIARSSQQQGDRASIEHNIRGQNSPASDGTSDENEASGLETEFGRLAIGNGKTRYVLSSFWASLDEEVGIQQYMRT